MRESIIRYATDIDVEEEIKVVVMDYDGSDLFVTAGEYLARHPKSSIVRVVITEPIDNTEFTIE